MKVQLHFGVVCPVHLQLPGCISDLVGQKESGFSSALCLGAAVSCVCFVAVLLLAWQIPEGSGWAQ